MSALRSVASRTGTYGPAMTVDSIATYLQAHGTPGFGGQLLGLLGNRVSGLQGDPSSERRLGRAGCWRPPGT